MKIKKNFLLLLGWLAFLLGMAGAFLPLLPTTPFLLLASYFFSKGSPKIHNWLLGLKTFGPQIRDYENYGVIKPKDKLYATVLIITSVSLFLSYSDRSEAVKGFVVGVIVIVIFYILTRPNSAKKE